MFDPNLIDVPRIIQLAIAPVFLIAGIGNLLNVLTSRLARVVDRGRAVTAAMSELTDAHAKAQWQPELLGLSQRMTRINQAITLSTIATLAVCLLISVMFAGEVLRLDLGLLIALLFMATMAALVAALLCFLSEIRIATRLLAIPTRLLE